MKIKYPVIINDSYCRRCEQFTNYEFIGLQAVAKGSQNYLPLYNAQCCSSTRTLKQLEKDLEWKINNDLGVADTEPDMEALKE